MLFVKEDPMSYYKKSGRQSAPNASRRHRGKSGYARTVAKKKFYVGSIWALPV
jgi:hypothetical protein